MTKPKTSLNHYQLPEITTERLVLRMLEPLEAPLVVAYHLRNKEHFEEFHPTYPQDFFTNEYWIEQLETNIQEHSLDQSLKLFVFEKDFTDTIIGTVNFSNFVRRAAQYCNVGYGIDKDKQSIGYMTEALRESVNYVFSELNLHRVMANYMPVNEKSAKVLRKVGFVVEGHAKDYLYLNDSWQDHILTSIINKDWLPDK